MVIRKDELVTKGYHDLTIKVITPPAGRESEVVEVELSGPGGTKTWATRLTWFEWDRIVSWVEWQRRERDFIETHYVEMVE